MEESARCRGKHEAREWLCGTSALGGQFKGLSKGEDIEGES